METTGLLQTNIQQSDQYEPSPCIERPFQIKLPGIHACHPEATGWAMDAAAKGPLHTSATFLGPALIHMAAVSARNHCPDCSDDELYVFFRFIRPSSVLAMSSMCVTLGAAVTLPFWGTIIDYSPYRKQIGALTAALLLLCTAVPIFLSSDNWPLVWVVQTILDYLYLLHNVIMLAYLQNLSTDATVLATYTTRFTILQSVFVATYMMGLTCYATFASASNMEMSRVAHIVSLLNGSFLLYYAWTFLLKERPRLHDMRLGASIFSSTVAELRTTMEHIVTHLPALKWFLWTLAFSPDAGAGTSRGMFATFMVSCLHMEASQIGFASFVILLSTIPGGYVSKLVCITLNPLVSFQLCLATWATTTAGCAWFVQGPEQLHWFYVAAAMWGMCLGWLVPTQRVLFCTLTPAGKEAELMGVLCCCHNSLAWLPPLVFGSLVKHVRLALASQVLFLGIALGLSTRIGTYDSAVRQAKQQ
jgi:MFS-type transporter involved in bile tolerance (Atg22 family)